MEDIKRKSMMHAIHALRLRALPPQYKDGDGFWTKAIVLARKRGFQESYAIAMRRGDGVFRYVRDFGYPGPILGLISIHPYEFIDMSLARDREGQEKRSYLQTFCRQKLRAVSAKFPNGHPMRTQNIERAQLLYNLSLNGTEEDVAMLEREFVIDKMQAMIPDDLPRWYPYRIFDTVTRDGVIGDGEYGERDRMQTINTYENGVVKSTDGNVSASPEELLNFQTREEMIEDNAIPTYIKRGRGRPHKVTDKDIEGRATRVDPPKIGRPKKERKPDTAPLVKREPGRPLKRK